MNYRKRFLSMITAIGLLGTTFLMPSVSADSDTLMNQDFSGTFTEDSFVRQYDLGLPENADSSKIYYYKSKDESALSIEDDTEKGKVLKMGITGGTLSAAFPLENTLSGGIVKFDADFKTVNDGSTQKFDHINISVINNELGNDGKKNLLQPNRTGDYASASAPVYGYATTSSLKGINLNFNQNEWNHVTYTLDMDNHTYTAEVTKADGTKTSTDTLSDVYNINEIRGISLVGYSNAPMYFANIKLQSIERELPVGEKLLASDDFEKYGLSQSITANSNGPFVNNGANITEGMVSGLWYTHNIANCSIVNLNEGTELAEDKALEFGASGGYAFLAFNEQNSGIISYEFEVKKTTEKQFKATIGDVGYSSSGGGRIDILQFNETKNVYRYDATGNPLKSTGFKWVMNEWYKVKIEFDHDGGEYYSYKITDANGNVMCQDFDIKINGDKTLKRARAFGFYGPGAVVNNVKVRKLEASEIKIENEVSKNIISDNFESGSIKMGKDLWGTTSSAQIVTEDAESTNHVLSMGKNAENLNQSAAWVANRDYKFESGKKYKIQFDIKPGGDQLISMLCLEGVGQPDGNAGSYYPVNFAVNTTGDAFTVGFHGWPGYISQTDTVSIEPGRWYTVTTTLDLENMKVSTTVNNKYEELGKEQFHIDSAERSIGRVPTSYGFCHHRILETDTRSMYDNFSITPICDQINATSDGISFKKQNGASIAYAQTADKAPIDISGISVNLNADVLSDSVNTKTVGLYDSKGNAVDCQVGVSGKNVELTLADGATLKSNTAYTLYLSDKLTAIDGKSLGTAKRFKFKTGVGPFKAEIDSLTVGDSQVVSLEGVASQKAKLNLKVTNLSEADNAINVYLAYFDNQGKLINVQPLKEVVSKDAVTQQNISIEFDILSSEILSAGNVENLKIFVWSDDCKPLCNLKQVPYTVTEGE